jgi:Tol biopolymer transport system component
MARRLAASALFALALVLAACGGDDGGGKKTVTSPGFMVEPGGGQIRVAPRGVGVLGGTPSKRTTSLLSTANGSLPNGPSRNATVSHDQRIARYIAYESDASDIVGGDANGQTDVFLVPRAQPYGQDGTPWRARGTQLISTGLGGAPANGRSYKPALDGDSHHAPHCVAFVSDASNLVPGDTNHKPDGFVYSIPTKTITRVTVDSRGRQSDGSTYDVSISGDCKRVAFTSDATNLALTDTTNRSWATARTEAVKPGTRQVYVHVLGGTRQNAVFKDLTFLASAAPDGKPGNGDSSEPSIARSGKAVVFSSTATNLAAGDRTATSDVYRRALDRKFVRRAGGAGVQTLRGNVALVSATPDGRAGNGPSRHPTVTDDTRYVAFETDASNILLGDSNGVTDIARADMGTASPTVDWVSATPLEGIADGASHDPVISDAGEFILFDSDATNLRPSQYVHRDANGVKDVFLWNAPTRNVSLESRDAQNGYLSQPSQDPATSSRGNYVAFETATGQDDQIYLRYLGPK